MKKIFIYLNIIAILAIAFSSCKQKTIRTIEKSLEQSFSLTSDTTKGSFRVNINVEIPVCYDDHAVLDSIRNSIISNLFGAEYVKFGNDSIVKVFVKDLITDYRITNISLLNQMDSSTIYSFDYEHTLEGFSLLSDEVIYSYGINRYVFMGGAHGLNNVYYFVFNLKNGKKITENDLYITGYESKLSELIKQRIVEQSKEDTNVAPILNLEDTDYWIDAIKPNGNFYVTDESINYVFNPYEIAPYYIGQTEVVIPFNRLKGLLKADNILAYLINK
ncbi:MAG: hypothetical protein H6Q20_787 [Bacteroidetes bacterium]|jgi:hypothetical protein|nr:hypothetical protein [Bacteroidota bacterium]